MPRSPQDIYARHLLSKRGYPLWTPEPSSELLAYRRDGLRIGDIGVVIPEDGYFDVFFNLCLPHDHPFHIPAGVPDNFRPIELDDTDIRTIINAENPGRIIAAPSVKTVRTSQRSGGSPSIRSGTRSTELEYEFSLSSSEGALLILPEGAEHRDLRNHRRFLEAATRHGADWYRFAEEKVGRIVGNDSLYLITGLYRTRSWSLAAFERTAGSAEYPAQLRLPQLGGGDSMTTCTWDTTRALDWRAGPVNNYGIPDQTVFIRGFKIAQRTRIFRPRQITVKADAPSTRPNPVKSVGAVLGDSPPAYISGDLSTGRTAESSSSSARDEVAVDPTVDAARNEIQNNGALAVGEDVVIYCMPEASQAFHPSDIINSYLLDKESSANIAVTHDDEWITLLEKNLLRPEDLAQEGLLETLISQNYDIFSEAGAVYLRSRHNDPGISSASDITLRWRAMPPSENFVHTVARGSRELGESRAISNDAANGQEDDIVIAVMGPTGSGKSTFICSASGQDIRGPEHLLKSFTDQVIPVIFWDQASGRHVVLVDMPGFDNESISDCAVLRMTSEWLASSYSQGKHLSGILYLHRIADNRMARTSLMSLQVFQKLCGEDALDKVHLTTTMWDEVDESVGEARLQELEAGCWKWMISRGAQTARCRRDNDSAKDLLRQIIFAELSGNEVTQAKILKHQLSVEAMAAHTEAIRNSPKKVLQIQEEIVDREMELKETAAGRELYSQLDALAERHRVTLRGLEVEIKKTTMGEDILTELRRERNALQANVHDLTRQMEELMLPGLKRLPHWR